MNLFWKRTLRTASSERFLAQREGKDVAVVDLHYLASGTVVGTVILLKEAGWNKSDVPALLGSLTKISCLMWTSITETSTTPSS
jgi:hypothetical protein